MSLKRLMSVWILGFLTFFASLNAFNAVLAWVVGGADSIVVPLFLGVLVDGVEAATYLWASVIATFILLGFTCVAVRWRSHEPLMLSMLGKLEEQLSKDLKALEDARADILGKLAVEGVRADENFRVLGKNLHGLNEEMERVMESGRKGMANVAKQEAQLTKITASLEKLEKGLTPQPVLESQDGVKKIKGVGPSFAKDLKSIGITNVGELITANPAVIAEATHKSRDMVGHFQTAAQLLMVPGVDENDVILLEEVGITSRRHLAEQDPIQLSARLAEIIKSNPVKGRVSIKAKPTIEEVSSWVRSAKF